MIAGQTRAGVASGGRRWHQEKQAEHRDFGPERDQYYSIAGHRV